MNEKQKNMNFKLNSALSIHNSSFKRLGDYIQLVDKRNKDFKTLLQEEKDSQNQLINAFKTLGYEL